MNSISERDNATKVIKSDGIQMSLNRVIVGDFDAVSGSTSNRTETYLSYGLITDYKRYDIDGTNIKIGDKKIILAAIKDMPEPTSDDLLVIVGVSWKIINCTPIAPSGIPILYQVQVRK